MTFRKKTGFQPRGAPQTQAPRTPTFMIRQSKAGTPYASINGGVAVTGRGSAFMSVFPSKFEGTFAAISLSGYRGGMIPLDGSQIDVDERTGVVSIDYGWLKIQVQGENITEFVEWLGYVAEMPREPSKYAQPSAPAEESPSEPEAPPARSGWKKPVTPAAPQGGGWKRR